MPKFELYEQESIDKLQAERDEILARCGVKFTEQYLNRTYDFEDGDITLKADEPSQPKSGKSAVKNSNEFAEPLPKSVIETIGEQLETEGEPYVENWLQDIRDRLQQSDNLEDFRNQLDSLIPELSFAEYGELLAWGMTAAEFAGRQSVMDEKNAKQKAKQQAKAQTQIQTKGATS